MFIFIYVFSGTKMHQLCILTWWHYKWGFTFLFEFGLWCSPHSFLSILHCTVK